MANGTRGRLPEYFSSQVRTARRFYLNLHPRPGGPLTVVSGGWERCADDYRIARTSFPYFGVEYVAGGAGTLRMGGRVHVLGRGSVYCYGPGVRHEIVNAPGERLAKYFVDFAGTGSLRLLRECGLVPGQVRVADQAEAVEKAFEELVRAGLSTGDHAARITALHLEILLVTLAEHGVGARSGDERARATFVRCRDTIEARCLELESVTTAAAACHVDAAYLCRLFARYSSASPYQFLQRLRMNHAAARLEDGGCLVREVSAGMGMDPFHFSRVFKRVHGLSPQAFLRRRRKG